MIDPDELRKHTQDALAHLYDATYLERHPLAQLVASAGGSEVPGQALRRLLLEAVQQLKPPPDAPLDTEDACRYRVLYLRYVRQEPIDQIGTKLSLSKRSLFRRQHEAVEAIATALERKLGPSIAARRLAAPPPAAEPSASTSAVDGGDPQQEIDRIATARPPTLVDLAEVTRTAMATVAGLAQEKRQSLALEVAPGVPPVSGDKIALRQAILGLLVFAIGANAGREVRPTLSASEADVSLRMQIRVGASGEVAERLDRDSNLQVGRRLIDTQGGALRWQITGQSLEIAVSFPVARPRVVLVVDDNQDTLRLFTRYLEPYPYLVITASDGDQARRAVDERQPDAVVLDVMLPSADGWEVLHALRSRPETARIPVVVCTVLKQEELARSLGATEFILKPVTRGTLLAALDRCTSYQLTARPARRG
ncbi:MAG: response regulator [Chloroflexi bacterium]|nr:response regulator [Chloroflexota bacterium]